MTRLSPPRIVLGLLCLLYFLLFMNRVNLATAAPLIKAEIHLTNSQLGLAFSVFALPYAVFQLIGGWIGDKFGARLILSLCCAVVVAATVLTGVGNGDGTEGAYAGRVVGTYLHGPALVRNPGLADMLLGWVVGTLPPLDPRQEDLVQQLRAERLAAQGAQ